MIIFKFFYKRKIITGKGREEEITLRKKLRSANYVPVDYKHTMKFIIDGINPLNDERKQLRNKNPDDLCGNMRDPAIEADSAEEISVGNRQYINHIYTIRTIIDMERGELKRAFCIREKLLKDLETYIAEEKRLRIKISEFINK